MIRSIAAFAVVLALAAPAGARTWRVAPSAAAQLQTTVRSAAPGDTIRLEAGRYTLPAPLALANGLTFEGAGAERTILAGPLDVTGADATIAALAIENAGDVGIAAHDCARLTVSGVIARSAAIAATDCSDVLIEKSSVANAAGAGVQLTRVRNAIVREVSVEGSGAGLALDASSAVDLRDSVARANAGGVLVRDSQSIRIFKNSIEANNAGRAAPEPFAAASGLAILGGRNIHAFENEIADHGGANVLIAASRAASADPAFNPLPRDIVIRNNTLGRAGFSAPEAFAALAAQNITLPDILWDGATIYSVAGAAPRTEQVRIRLDGNGGAGGDGRPTFLSLGIPIAGVDVSEAAPDTALPAAGRIAEPPAVRLPQD